VLSGAKVNTTVLFVSNIPYSATEEQLAQHFKQIESAKSVQIIKHKETQQSRGFGFVKMSQSSATEALEKLHKQDFMGRSLFLDIACPQVSVPHHSKY
jgi:nucleolin